MKKISVPNPSAIVVKKVSDNLYVVNPGFVTLGSKPTTVTWSNQTADKIEIFVPAHGITNKQVISIPPGKTDSIVTNSVKNDSYLYTVYCHEGKQFAVAGSHPEMIVP